jgi:hypothetical protein
MQSSSNSYFKILLVIAAWLTCIIAIYGSYDHENLFNYFANRVLVGIASIITLIVFFRDNSQYKREQDLKAFMATITAGACVGVLLLTILFATAGKVPHKSIDLRKDNSFKITNSSLFEKEFIRGPYVIKDSLLILDSVSVGTMLETHRFVARSIPYNDSIIKSEEPGLIDFFMPLRDTDTSAQTYLIPIDANGTVIKNARSFHVGWKPPGD